MITRKERNRRGGHKSTSLPNHRFGDELLHYSPVERKLIKRLSKKAVRRQYRQTAKAIEAALLNDWTIEDFMHEWDEIDLDYDGYSIFDDYDEEEEIRLDGEYQISLQDPYFDGRDYLGDYMDDHTFFNEIFNDDLLCREDFF